MAIPTSSKQFQRRVLKATAQFAAELASAIEEHVRAQVSAYWNEQQEAVFPAGRRKSQKKQAHEASEQQGEQAVRRPQTRRKRDPEVSEQPSVKWTDFAVSAPAPPRPRLDIAPDAERWYCGMPQNETFFDLFSTFQPYKTPFLITISADGLHGELMLADHTETRIAMFRNIFYNLQSTCYLSGLGDPRPGTTVSMEPGQVVREGEYWRLEEKITLTW